MRGSSVVSVLICVCLCPDGTADVEFDLIETGSWISPFTAAFLLLLSIPSKKNLFIIFFQLPPYFPLVLSDVPSAVPSVRISASVSLQIRHLARSYHPTSWLPWPPRGAHLVSLIPIQSRLFTLNTYSIVPAWPINVD